MNHALYTLAYMNSFQYGIYTCRDFSSRLIFTGHQCPITYKSISEITSDINSLAQLYSSKNPNKLIFGGWKNTNIFYFLLSNTSTFTVTRWEKSSWAKIQAYNGKKLNWCRRWRLQLQLTLQYYRMNLVLRQVRQKKKIQDWAKIGSVGLLETKHFFFSAFNVIFFSWTLLHVLLQIILLCINVCTELPAENRFRLDWK